jgi:hypothetical protein
MLFSGVLYELQRYSVLRRLFFLSFFFAHINISTSLSPIFGKKNKKEGREKKIKSAHCYSKRLLFLFIRRRNRKLCNVHEYTRTFSLFSNILFHVPSPTTVLKNFSVLKIDLLFTASLLIADA